MAVLAGVALALTAVTVVLAQTGTPGDKVVAGADITVPAGSTIEHDLYAFGGTLTVDGTIQGDLVAAAARIVVTGTVTGDMLAAASEVTIAGTVGGDLRLASGQVLLSGPISEDVAAVTSLLTIEPAATIGGDLLFTATRVTMDGSVGGGVSGSASDYQRGGTVNGPEQVTLATRLDQPPPDRAVALGLDALRQYVVVLLVGLALLRFLPGFLQASAERVRTQPLQSSGAGVIVILAYVGLMIALIVTGVLVGLVFGQLDFGTLVMLDVVGTLVTGFGLTFALVAFATFVADAVVGLALGRLVAVSERSPYAGAIQLAVGAALVVVLTSFPAIGELFKLLVILVALGAVSTVVVDARRGRRAAIAPPAQPA